MRSADAHDDFHVVFDEENGQAEALHVELSDHVHEFAFFGGVHAGGGFVEQQHLGAGGQGAGDFEAALVAIGERLARSLARWAEVEEVEVTHGVAAARASSR